jgi:ABC-type transporter lipoprotein component MlaA
MRTLGVVLSAANLPPGKRFITETSPGWLGLIDAASKAGEDGRG